MPVEDLIYLSNGKLNRFLLSQPRSRALLDRLSFEVATPQLPGFPSAKVTLNGRPGHAGEIAGLRADYDLLMEILDELDRSDSPQLWITDPSVASGTYVEFDAAMRFGRMHRENFRPDLADPPMVFFFGVAETDPPVSLLFTGWAGHMVEDYGLLDRSMRMGSGTNDIYDLFRHVVSADRNGAVELPEEFGRLARETGRVDGFSLETAARWAAGVAASHLPPETTQRLRGVVEILAVLSSSNEGPTLILGSPLYVARARGVPIDAYDPPVAAAPEPKRSWWRRARQQSD